MEYRNKVCLDKKKTFKTHSLLLDEFMFQTESADQVILTRGNKSALNRSNLFW